MPSHLGFTAWLESSSHPLPEYVPAPEIHIQGSICRVYVESLPGKEFKVHWSDDRPEEYCRQSSGQVFVDGVKHSGKVLDPPRKRHIWSSGRRIDAERSRAYVFGHDPPHTMGVDVVADQANEGMGVIQVRMENVRVLAGCAPAKGRGDPEATLTNAPAVPHPTSPMSGLGSIKTSRAIARVTVKLDKDPFLVFEFVCRTRGFLQTLGVPLRPPIDFSQAPPPRPKNYVSAPEAAMDEMGGSTSRRHGGSSKRSRVALQDVAEMNALSDVIASMDLGTSEKGDGREQEVKRSKNSDQPRTASASVPSSAPSTSTLRSKTKPRHSGLSSSHPRHLSSTSSSADHFNFTIPPQDPTLSSGHASTSALPSAHGAHLAQSPHSSSSFSNGRLGHPSSSSDSRFATSSGLGLGNVGGAFAHASGFGGKHVSLGFANHSSNNASGGQGQ